MAKRGAPTGNLNSSKGRLWTDAIRHALLTYEDDKIKRKQALSAIAKKLVKDAINGDKDSWQEIGNRLDGKPAQTIHGPGEEGEHTLIHRIEEVIVDSQR